MRKASSFRALGGDIIPLPMGSITEQVIVSPDPGNIELALLEIAHDLEAIEIPLIGAQRIVRNDMQARFETESDPDGNPWLELDEEYAKAKEAAGYPPDILYREGDLKKAATAQDAFIIDGETIFLDTSGFPEYGLLHQTGTGSPLNVGIAARHRRRSASDPEYKREIGGGHSSQGIGRGSALPARPFIGMSEEAEAEVWSLFDQWFETATEIEEEGRFVSSGVAINPKTGAAQVRGPGGRFGKKLKL